MYDDFAHLTQPVEVRPSQDGQPWDHETTALHYRWVANVERANQLLLIPYILVVAPFQLDKSYTAIMSASFQIWSERVERFTAQAKAAQETPSVAAVREKIEEALADPVDLPYCWREIS